MVMIGSDDENALGDALETADDELKLSAAEMAHAQQLFQQGALHAPPVVHPQSATVA